MKKRSIKKILATSMLVLTFASMATFTSYAAKKNYSFAVTTSQNSGAAFSAGNAKDDNEQTAYVVTQSGNIISSDLFYMAVYKTPVYSSTNRVTSWKRITNNSATYTINYTTYRAKSSTNYLCGDTDKYSVSVEGYWYS